MGTFSVFEGSENVVPKKGPFWGKWSPTGIKVDFEQKCLTLLPKKLLDFWIPWKTRKTLILRHIAGFQLLTAWKYSGFFDSGFNEITVYSVQNHCSQTPKSAKLHKTCSKCLKSGKLRKLSVFMYALSHWMMSKNHHWHSFFKKPIQSRFWT